MRWGDLPDEVRRRLEPVLPGPEPHPIVEVQFFAKDTPTNQGLAVVKHKRVAWNIVWDSWCDPRRGILYAWRSNPWRKHHTPNYWVWFRRGAATDDKHRSKET